MRKWFIPLLAVLALSACGNLPPEKMKLTLRAEVDGREVSASAVQVIHQHKQLTYVASMDTDRTAIEGESVVLPLGDGRTLFTTFSGGRKQSHDGLAWQIGDGLRAGNGKAVTLDPAAMPMIVTFDDPADPLTVKAIDPADPAAVLGGRVSHIRIEVEPATGPVTRGQVVKALPWLAHLKTLLDGRGATISNALSNKLDKSDFISDGRV